MEARIRLWLRALIVIAAIAPPPSQGLADPGGGVVSVGDRVRYARVNGHRREGTVVASGVSRIVVAGDYDAWRDTVGLASLESLEVRLKSFNMFLGLVGGMAVGAIAGGAVAGIAVIGNDDAGAELVPYVIGAPLGALVGGVFGLAYAHDRGMHWKRVALLSIPQGAESPPNTAPQPAAPCDARCRPEASGLATPRLNMGSLARQGTSVTSRVSREDDGIRDVHRP